MPKISIIIPVYNVEKCLRKCLASVASQTFTDYECILVDDKSPDNCPNICNEYVQKYEKFKVIHNKKNQGQSHVRHTGLLIAKSDLVMFIDSDDWIEPNTLEILYNEQQKTNADVVMGGIRYIYENKNIEYVPPDITGTEPLVYLFLNICRSLWGKIYKINLFSDLLIPDLNMGEDAITNAQIFSRLSIDKIRIIPDFVYNYNQLSNGITKQKLPNFDFMHENPHIKARLWIEEYLQNILANKEIKDAFAFYYLESGFIPYFRTNKKIRKADAVTTYQKYYRNNPYKNRINKKDRVLLFLLYFFYPLGLVYVTLLRMLKKCLSIFTSWR